MTDQSKPTRISAKVLGELSMPNACPRCFWLKNKCKPLPYQIFPGIFSSIDSYSKKLVHAAFDHYGHAPAWLPALKSAYRYLKVPHWSKFCRTHKETGIVLSGVPDGIFENIDKTLTIPDYKTAKYTKAQDKLFPMYETQLNGYAWIQNGLTSAQVSALWLFYFQPVTSPTDSMFEKNFPPETFNLDYKDFVSEGTIWPISKYIADGFDMQFEVHTVKVDILSDLIDKLLHTAKDILDQVEPPRSLTGCKECAHVTKMYELLWQFQSKTDPERNTNG